MLFALLEEGAVVMFLTVIIPPFSVITLGAVWICCFVSIIWFRICLIVKYIYTCVPLANLNMLHVACFKYTLFWITMWLFFNPACGNDTFKLNLMFWYHVLLFESGKKSSHMFSCFYSILTKCIAMLRLERPPAFASYRSPFGQDPGKCPAF